MDSRYFTSIYKVKTGSVKKKNVKLLFPVVHFLCGLHEVYSRTMLRPDLFIYLFIYLFICLRETSACHVV